MRAVGSGCAWEAVAVEAGWVGTESDGCKFDKKRGGKTVRFRDTKKNLSSA